VVLFPTGAPLGGEEVGRLEFGMVRGKWRECELVLVLVEEDTGGFDSAKEVDAVRAP